MILKDYTKYTTNELIIIANKILDDIEFLLNKMSKNMKDIANEGTDGY